MSNKKSDIETYQPRPILTSRERMILREFAKQQFNEKPAGTAPEELWFHAVIDLLWMLGYKLDSRHK